MKTHFSRWHDRTRPESPLREDLLHGVDRILQELPSRQHWLEVMSVGLDGGREAPLAFRTSQMNVFPVGDYLGVTTIVPAWGIGWRNEMRNDDVYQVLSWFMHYSRQYIHRSLVARVLMVAWEEHEVVLHPFGSVSSSHRFGPMVPFPGADSAFEISESSALSNWSSGKDLDKPVASSSLWGERNTLDPYLHQGIFYFLRGQKLGQKGFAQEAVVAFDCTIQCVSGFLHARKKIGKTLTRKEVCAILDLDSESGECADYAYFLRNNFGAHAGGWRWWDFCEEVSDHDLTEIGRVAGIVLAAAADLEPEIRAIDPKPNDWSRWFTNNFKTLWGAVWFEKFDSWHAQSQDA